MIRNLGENINDRFELDTQGKFLPFLTQFYMNQIHRPSVGSHRRYSAILRVWPGLE